MLLPIGSDLSAHEQWNESATKTVEKRFAWSLGTMGGR
jgi:hypothetical protein